MKIEEKEANEMFELLAEVDRLERDLKELGWEAQRGGDLCIS